MVFQWNGHNIKIHKKIKLFKQFRGQKKLLENISGVFFFSPQYMKFLNDLAHRWEIKLSYIWKYIPWGIKKNYHLFFTILPFYSASLYIYSFIFW